jgi:hypothetical protein
MTASALDGAPRRAPFGPDDVLFPDRETEKRALAFLLGRFSGRVLRSGEHLVPEAALEALADRDIPFTVQGKAAQAQRRAAIRDGVASLGSGAYNRA